MVMDSPETPSIWLALRMASLAGQTLFLTRAVGALKRVWSSEQGGLVSIETSTPRFSRRANH